MSEASLTIGSVAFLEGCDSGLEWVDEELGKVEPAIEELRDMKVNVEALLGTVARLRAKTDRAEEKVGERETREKVAI